MTSVIYWLFLASGAAGLIYEVVWMRILMRILGATVLAYTIVLAAFMLGLALGGWRFGRRIDHRGQPLLVYAALETGVGLWALLLPSLLTAALALFVSIARGLADSPVLLNIIRSLIAFAALLLPTILMGGTLPVLSKSLVHSGQEIGNKVGKLYAVNTFGAILGAGAAGFILLGKIGEIRTTLIAVALNLTAAAGAALLARSLPQPPDPRRGAQQCALAESPASPSLARQALLLVVVAITGFTILAYEVLWTRTAVLLTGNTTYSFSLMLLAFLTGIAVGSAIMAAAFRTWNPSWAVRWRTLATLQLLIGLVALFSFAAPVPAVTITFPIWRKLGLTNLLPGPVPALFLLLAPLTLISGASFPVAASLCVRDLKAVGSGVGSVYLWNTLGAAAGSAVVGLVLLPAFGITNSFLICIALNLLAGLVLLASTPAAALGHRARPALAWLGFAAVSFAIIWPATGGLQIPRTLLRKVLERSYRKCLFYQEDVNGIVSVWINPLQKDPWFNNKRLYIDAQPMAVAYRYGMIYERLQAHYPLLLHPDPKDALVICLGTGTTLGSVGQYPVSTIDCVELSRSVVDAGVCFKEETHNILDDPRLTIHITDGRNYLLSTSKTYDVITAEPMHPHLAGTVNLYTKEYFQLVKSRLRPGGICSHWIPLHRMRPDEVKQAIQAFRAVFPHCLLFVETADAIILGSDQTLKIDVDRWRRFLKDPRIALDLEEVGLSGVPQLLSTYMMDNNGLQVYADNIPPVTDDRPTLEFYGSDASNRAGLALNVREIVERRAGLDSLRSHLIGRFTEQENAYLSKLYPLESDYLRAYADYASGDYVAARDGFTRVLQVAPEDKRAEISRDAITRSISASQRTSGPGAFFSPMP